MLRTSFLFVISVVCLSSKGLSDSTLQAAKNEIYNLRTAYTLGNVWKCVLSQCTLHMELCTTKILFVWVGKDTKHQ